MLPEVESFRAALFEAKLWCATRDISQSPAAALRSSALTPSASLFKRFEISADARYREIVSDVVERRRKLLTAHREQAPRTLPLGRILVIFYALLLYDELGAEASQGFMDRVDAPPWDTWIQLSYPEHHISNQHWSANAYLLAWIPQPFESLVSRAIRVSPTDALQWAEHVDNRSEFIYTLRECGDLPCYERPTA